MGTWRCLFPLLDAAPFFAQTKKGSPVDWTPALSTQVVFALLVTGTIRPSASA